MAETTTPKGKKLPPWLIIGGGAAVVLVVYYYKKKKEQEEEGGGKNPYTAQSFVPVTAENVAGVGAPQAGAAPGSEASLNLLLPFVEAEKKERAEIEKTNKEFTQSLIQSIIGTQTAQVPQVTVVTGGGAPASGPSSTGPPSGGTPKGTPRAPVCPPDFPNYNPQRKDCWRWSRTTVQGGCKCHGYKSGALVCEHRQNGRCTF